MRPDRKAMLSAALTLISVSLPIALTAAPNAWSDDAMPREQIQSRCDKAAQLFMKKDVGGFSEIVAQDAMIFGNGKMLRYEEWKQALSKELASMQNLRTSIHVERCEISGKTAVAHVVKNDDFTSLGEARHKFHAVGRITLNLTRTDKGWVSTQWVFESPKLTRDGKKCAPK